MKTQKNDQILGPHTKFENNEVRKKKLKQRIYIYSIDVHNNVI